MILYEGTKIRSYENFIRDIINSIVSKIDFDKLNDKGETFLSKVKERFRFDNNNGWKFLTSCLDIVGDSQFAIIEFINSNDQDSGSNSGSAYLRIYGILSAVYIQQQAIIKLSELFKIHNLDNIKNQFKDTEITFLRHCISAHPINFNFEGKKTSFKIDRYSLFHNGNLSVRDELNNNKIYNIYIALDQYKSIAEDILENVARKLINNAYQSSKEKVDELNKKLELIKNDVS